ncbi:HAD family hydrolase [Altibacter sp. HG106]|uniref:HAD family hydrolase n=1 Tax=Altibacter sp. HG106 TaxID=3023937 RepID=UPI0023508576|nr:HAD family phosphatase [Altibacter sp. HG106]MDC7993685.1 HAD family phosphatase [Altibacter sp. HG106]
MSYNTIIFDLGGVLVDWNPEYVFLKEFRGDREKMNWFLNTVCSWDWNENQDAGYPLAQATEDKVKEFPEYEDLIRMYYGRWEEMLGYAHDDTLAILKQTVENPGLNVFALTNWSGETFPKALSKFEWLQWFDGIVVSGDEKTRKPFADIYELALSRYDITPSEAIFIDDNKRNVAAAEKLGITALHFTGAKQLATDLNRLGITLNSSS